MRKKLMVCVAGGGLGDRQFTNDTERNFELDSQVAADELRQAGCEAFLLLEKYAHHLAHPLDNFIEAHIEGTDDPKVIDAIVNEVAAIVGRYGGICIEGSVLRTAAQFGMLYHFYIRVS
jgi:hypothetical protein